MNVSVFFMVLLQVVMPWLNTSGELGAYHVYGLIFILMAFVDNLVQLIHKRSNNIQEYHHNHDHPLVHGDDNPPIVFIRCQILYPLLPADTNITSSSYGSNHDIDSLEHPNTSTER